MLFGKDASRHFRLTAKTPRWDRNEEWVLLTLTMGGEVVADAHYLVEDLQRALGDENSALVSGYMCLCTGPGDAFVGISVRGRRVLDIPKSEFRNLASRRSLSSPLRFRLGWLTGING